MPSNEKTGVDFVLYATDTERRAIKAVRLFLELARILGYQLGLDQFQVRVDKLHSHFPEFALSLRLFASRGKGSLYELSPEGRCPAVELHGKAYDDPRWGKFAYLFYLHQHQIPIVEEILRKAQEAGVFPDLLEYELLLNTAYKVLKKMGSLPATVTPAITST